MSPVLRAIASCLVLVAPTVTANLQRHFESPITESVWRTAGDPLACRLVHDIPEYGRAVFTRHAGGRLDFRLDLNQRPGATGDARIRAVPPPWKHDAAARDLGTIAFADRTAPFTLGGAQAGVLLASLEEGLFPTFSYQGRSPAADSVSVSLSAVNFLDSLDAFHHCAEALLPEDFAGVRDSRLLFSPGSATLDSEAQARLDQIATWMTLDWGIARASIAGYTDTSGHRRENYLLSQRRATAVRDYLAAKGVGKARMRVRFYGEERPLQKGDGAIAQNRRVEVRLSR